MFLEHYSLRQQPFGVTPDSRFLFLSESHREALASLIYGAEENRGFITLIAPPGMGKTTLLFRFMEQLRDSSSMAFLFQTQCNSQEFLRYLLADMKIECAKDDIVEMHEKLNYALLRIKQAGSRFVLIIDEAQNLSDSVLETVRLLSDFETPTAKLMQIILVGQPQLAGKLASPKLTQLRQRISIWAKVTPFSPEETSAYIDHRLAVAGANGRSLFTREARQLIASYSGGTPRNINALCFNALSLGCALGQKHVDANTVREVASDLDLHEMRGATFNPTPYPVRDVTRIESTRPQTTRPRPTILQLSVLTALGVGAGLLWSPIVRSSSNLMKSGAIAAITSASPQKDRMPEPIQTAITGPGESRTHKIHVGSQIAPGKVDPASATRLPGSSSWELARARSNADIALNEPHPLSNDIPYSASSRRTEKRLPDDPKGTGMKVNKAVVPVEGKEVATIVQHKNPTWVRPNKRAEAAVTEKGAIAFVTDPPGLNIVIDAKAYGPSPVRAVLPAGLHTYRVEGSKATQPMSGEFELPPSTVRIETVRPDNTLASTAATGTSQSIEKSPPELH